MSSSDFVLDKFGNDFVHLTNNAIQKNSEDYGQLEDGNILSFGDLRKYLQDQNLGDFERDILPKMKY